LVARTTPDGIDVFALADVLGAHRGGFAGLVVDEGPACFDTCRNGMYGFRPLVNDNIAMDAAAARDLAIGPLRPLGVVEQGQHAFRILCGNGIGAQTGSRRTHDRGRHRCAGTTNNWQPPASVTR